MKRRPRSYASHAIVVTVAAAACVAFAGAAAAASADPTPFAFPTATAAPTHQAQTVRVQLLDAVVFLIGASLLGGALFWWGRRIFSSDDRS